MCRNKARQFLCNNQACSHEKRRRRKVVLGTCQKQKECKESLSSSLAHPKHTFFPAWRKLLWKDTLCIDLSKKEEESRQPDSKNQRHMWQFAGKVSFPFCQKEYPSYARLCCLNFFSIFLPACWKCKMNHPAPRQCFSWCTHTQSILFATKDALFLGVDNDLYWSK